MIGVSSAGCNERAHRSGFGDSFFENLPVLRFLVVEERVHVDGLVKLADAGIDANLAEERFHAEGAGFVRNDGHNQLADFGITEKFRQEANKNHSGRGFSTFRTFVELLEMRFSNRTSAASRAPCAVACTRRAVCGAPACT